jgi:hypothetical protein
MNKQHLIYQINNCQIRTWPWNHVVLDKIFTNADYTAILKNLPPISCLTESRLVPPHLRPVNVDMTYSPQRFILAEVEDIPDLNQQVFWQDIKNTFLDGAVKQAVLHRFWDLILQRIGPDLINTVEFYDGFELTLDRPGYDLKPHPDRFAKIFSLVINLASDTSHTDMGTAVYTSKNPADLVYKTDYAPNTGFGIFRSEDSWHGVETTDVDRWSIQYIVLGRDRDH